jgi:riboflavin kinase/FMN adenylyltransferase
VYAARARWDGESAAAVVNVGVRPTVDGRTRVVEAHLLDASPDLYGRQMTLAFLHRIRSERRFPSADALRDQISEDIAEARRMLGSTR